MIVWIGKVSPEHWLPVFGIDGRLEGRATLF
jgi:hypothetical protein